MPSEMKYRQILSALLWISFASFLHETSADGSASGFGSDAIIGIIVAAVLVLMIVIGSIVTYLVCRARQRAAKDSTSSEPEPTVSGQALPVDIPIEAVNRLPPPSYAPPVNHHQRPRRPSAGRNAHRPHSGNNAPRTAASSPPPPPYSATPGAIATVYVCREEDPPVYQSRIGLNSSVTVGGGEPVRDHPRSISIDSFSEYPSMRNILLTSSRSSIHTDSRHASQSDRSSGNSASASAHAQRVDRFSGGDSARGESVDSKSNRSDEASNLRQSYVRSISTSASALDEARMNVPDSDLQRKVRKSKQKTTDLSNAASDSYRQCNRSCPSLNSDDIDTSRNRSKHRDLSETNHRRGRDETAEDADISTNSASQKRRRYRRKSGSGNVNRQSTSTEYSGDLENRVQYRTGQVSDSDSLSSGLNMTPTASRSRLRVAGSSDV